tara:strand:+ start:2188 stop:3459 length:1272 start_codon:yes stop_codon:yes gene_type:complete
MLDGIKKWFQVGGSEYNSPSWNWQTAGRGWNNPKGSPPSQEQLASLAGVNRACTLFSDSTASQAWTIRQQSPSGGSFDVMGSDAAHALADWDYEGRELFLFSAALLGNGFAVIHRNSRGGAGFLESVTAWRVSIEWSDSRNLMYRIAEDENLQQPERMIPATDMLHLKFRTTGRHPLFGVSPLTQLAPALAPYFSIRDGLSEVFRWVTMPGSYFGTEERLSFEQINQIRAAIEQRESGRPVILGGGLEMKDVPIPALDRLQTIEMSRFGIEEVARCWGLPVSMLSQTEGINYSSAAEQSRQFVTISLQPFAKRVESSLNGKLLTREDRMAGISTHINLLPLLLGHGSERSEYFSRMVNAGIMSTNEARQQTGLADVTDGDVLRAPVNTRPIDQWNEPKPEPVPVPVPVPERTAPRIVKFLESV